MTSCRAIQGYSLNCTSLSPFAITNRSNNTNIIISIRVPKAIIHITSDEHHHLYLSDN